MASWSCCFALSRAGADDFFPLVCRAGTTARCTRRWTATAPPPPPAPPCSCRCCSRPCRWVHIDKGRGWSAARWAAGVLTYQHVAHWRSLLKRVLPPAQRNAMIFAYQ